MSKASAVFGIFVLGGTFTSLATAGVVAGVPAGTTVGTAVGQVVGQVVGAVVGAPLGMIGSWVGDGTMLLAGSAGLLMGLAIVRKKQRR